jgi:lactoylglutathione lyase
LGLVEVSRYDNEAGRFTLIFLSATGDVEKSMGTARPGMAPLQG